MMNFFKRYITAFITFFILDLVWLGIVASKLYKDKLGFIMSPKLNWLAAILFYLIYIVGIIFFVVNPAIEKKSWSYALLGGIFFGFITYATYDLTNLATLTNWPLSITVVDLIWGSTLVGIVSLLTFKLVTK